MKSSKVSKKPQQKPKPQMHWALETCSNVQLVLTIPMLILLFLLIIIYTFILIAHLVKPQPIVDKMGLGVILLIIIVSSILFFGTIWVYRRYPQFLCYLLIANLVFAIITSLAH